MSFLKIQRTQKSYALIPYFVVVLDYFYSGKILKISFGFLTFKIEVEFVHLK